MPIRTEITSPKNPAVARVRAAARGETPGVAVVDGVRIVAEAVALGLPIRFAACSDKVLEADGGHELRAQLEARADESAACSQRVIERMSSLETPQGVLAVVEIGPRSLDEVLDAVPEAGSAQPWAGGLVTVAAGVRDPGNLGALLRSTEAAGGTGFVTLPGSADPFRDKAVRGSSGSVLRVPVARAVEPAALLAALRDRGWQVVVADGASESADYVDVDFTKPTAVVVGAEGQGVPDALRAGADHSVRIPMRAPVESLNVAVAAGVLLFEARRQRR